MSTTIRVIHCKDKPLMVSRELIYDKRVSLKAKGVLLFLLCLSDGENITHEQVKEGLGIGSAQLRSTIAELMGAGYIERYRCRSPEGRIQPYKYKIFGEAKGKMG